MLAAMANLPQATFASKVTITDVKVTVAREVDGGAETLALKMPAVVTTDLRLNEPRYVTLLNIMKANGVDVAPMLKVAELTRRSAGMMVADVKVLVDKLKTEAKML